MEEETAIIEAINAITDFVSAEHVPLDTAIDVIQQVGGEPLSEAEAGALWDQIVEAVPEQRTAELLEGIQGVYGTFPENIDELIGTDGKLDGSFFTALAEERGESEWSENITTLKEGFLGTSIYPNEGDLSQLDGQFNMLLEKLQGQDFTIDAGPTTEALNPLNDLSHTESIQLTFKDGNTFLFDGSLADINTNIDSIAENYSAYMAHQADIAANTLPSSPLQPEPGMPVSAPTAEPFAGWEVMTPPEGTEWCPALETPAIETDEISVPRK